MCKLHELVKDIRACSICASYLPLTPRPIFQAGAAASILIAAQAPGLRAHETGLPFNDKSGDRLRSWLGVERDLFYNPDKMALVPMGFCYPGRGKSGDLPPRAECAPAWRRLVLGQLHHIQLTVIIGQYALNWHWPDRQYRDVTTTVKNWQARWPQWIVLPHPSPRNNIWLKRNPWFEAEIIPQLQQRVAQVLSQPFNV